MISTQRPSPSTCKAREGTCALGPSWLGGPWPCRPSPGLPRLAPLGSQAALTLAGVALADQPHHQGGAVAALRGAGEGLDAELVRFRLQEEGQGGETRAVGTGDMSACNQAFQQLQRTLEKLSHALSPRHARLPA